MQKSGVKLRLIMSDPKDTNLINTNWFKSKLKQRGYTHQMVADKLGLSNSTVVSHILAGRRKIAPEEMAGWAEILAVSMADVFNNAYGTGVRTGEWLVVQGHAHAVDRIKVLGWADSTFEVRLETASVGPTSIPNPLPGELDGTASGVGAIHCRTAGTAFDIFDGGVMVFKQINGIDADAIGRICLVELFDQRLLIRVLNRGYSQGKYNLSFLNLQPAEQNIQVLSASPILSIKI